MNISFQQQVQQRTVQLKIDAGFKWIESQGFRKQDLDVLQDKMLNVKAIDPTLSTHPKLAALYAWIQQVKADALAGNKTLLAAPFSLIDVLSE